MCIIWWHVEPFVGCGARRRLRRPSQTLHESKRMKNNRLWCRIMCRSSVFRFHLFDYEFIVIARSVSLAFGCRSDDGADQAIIRSSKDETEKLSLARSRVSKLMSCDSSSATYAAHKANNQQQHPATIKSVSIGLFRSHSCTRTNNIRERAIPSKRSLVLDAAIWLTFIWPIPIETIEKQINAFIHFDDGNARIAHKSGRNILVSSNQTEAYCFDCSRSFITY